MTLTPLSTSKSQRARSH